MLAIALKANSAKYNRVYLTARRATGQRGRLSSPLPGAVLSWERVLIGRPKNGCFATVNSRTKIRVIGVLCFVFAVLPVSPFLGNMFPRGYSRCDYSEIVRGVFWHSFDGTVGSLLLLEVYIVLACIFFVRLKKLLFGNVLRFVRVFFFRGLYGEVAQRLISPLYHRRLTQHRS